MNTLISVIITNYNYGNYIEKAIESIYQQTYKNLELIIIDDGSTDGSKNIIKQKIQEAPENFYINFISRENLGIVRTRNEGMQNTHGEYFVFLDADDYFDASYIEKMYSHALASGADIVYPNWHVFDETGDIDYETDFPEFDIRKYQLQKLHVSSESLVRTAAVEDFEFRSEKVAEDWDFFNRLALSGKKFQLAKDCRINYFLKEDGRGSKNRAIDDIIEFENLIDGWRQEYGDNQVLAKNELLIEKFSELENHAQNLEKISKERLQTIRKQEDDIRIQLQDIQNLNYHLHLIQNSKTYKCSKYLSAFLKLIKNPKRLPSYFRKIKHKLGDKARPLTLIKKKFLTGWRNKQRAVNNYTSPKRALVYVIYESQDIIQEYKIIFLEALSKLSDRTLIVVNGNCTNDDIQKLSLFGQVVCRPNEGYDTAAFRYGIQFLNKELQEYDELILVNDTNVGPMTDLQDVFDQMAKKRLDFWGISYGEAQDDFTGYNKYGRIPIHLQSYFLVIEKSLFATKAFRDYWEQLEDTDSRNKAIGKHETVFTKHFENLGYKHGAVSGNNHDSAMYIHPLTMLRNYGVPLVKYTAFSNDTDDKFSWQGLERKTEVPKLLEYIEQETDYPIAVINQIMTDLRNKNVKEHILIIDGVENKIPQCTRYRVENKAEQLRSLGHDVWTVNASEFQMGYAEHASHIIIYRTGYSKQLSDLVTLAKKYNKPVYYDIDDLVIDVKYTDLLQYTQELSEIDKMNYDAGVRSYGDMLNICDAAITTTSKLKKELQHYKSEVFMNRNLASKQLVTLSSKVIKNYEHQEGRVRLGYFSGSITHNENFDLIRGAVLEILEKYSNVELHLVGHLDIPEEFRVYKNQLVAHNYVDWKELPALISQIDINLAPLVDSIFNQAKSEIKWIEAGLVKVPTIASNLGSFAEMLIDEETALLANEDEWFDKLEKLIINKALRQEIAENAYKIIMSNCVAENHQDELTRKINEIY
ncbi:MULTISPECIES: rhamnan synthesis F family protein [Lactococcus]|uniref:rhamnan synthesis F family protein n=1 Tax=Lactococcus TaxID=1357 RepID=UPI00156E35F6|nr:MULTISPECIES: rhamnan synthesis F family protein [Lactococcus]NSL25682.1 glycosyltransferase [Lactococcus petauri]QSR04587.1 glycosyltransferase [Lactococcus sp. LG1267]